MKKAAVYAHALHEASQTKNDSEMDIYFDTFIALLKQKSEYKMLPSITREYKALTAREVKNQGSVLIVRDSADADTYKQELKGVSDVFDTNKMQVIEDKTIVGGFIAKNSTNMLDRSYKKGLVQLYKDLVK